MGRHVSPTHRRSLRGATAAALAGIVVLVAAAGFATYGIWSRAREPATARQAGSTAARTGAPSPATAATSSSAPTLALTVTGPSCEVFVGVPGGDVLVNRVLVRGQSVRFDDLRLNVALSDGGAVQVYVNGRPRPPGPAGVRVQFSAVRE